jgi:diacylglycerol O-acyltransferase
LVGRASRLISSMKVFDRLRPAFNVTISNVPGPPFPLFLAGGRMVGFYPLGPVAEGVGLNMTVMSYCGIVYFGLNACRETVPRLADLPRMLDEAFDELLAVARPARRQPTPRKRRATGVAAAKVAVAASASAAGEELADRETLDDDEIVAAAGAEEGFEAVG